MMRFERRAYSLVGMLFTLVIMVVLFAIGMNAMNKAVTGQGSTKQGTVRSMQDEMTLYAIYQSFIANAPDQRGRFVQPSLADEDGGVGVDTTANLYSLMIMRNYVTPDMLISANEQSDVVWADDDYDYNAYQPARGAYWDPTFAADLDHDSNVSFAHMPLCGERCDKGWRSDFTSHALIGNRGPKDGAPDPNSWTYGRDGTWAGHVCYGNGSIQFESSFTPPNLTIHGAPDNLYIMEDGPFGNDSMLGFTKAMTREGPELQWD